MSNRLPLRFRSGIKHMVEEYPISFQTDFRPLMPISWRWLSMDTDGLLRIDKGYVWDGVSGPVVDRKSNYSAGLCHDALYQLMRREKLDYREWRKADLEYAKLLKRNGAWWLTIKTDMAGLAFAQGMAADPKSKYKIHTAP